MKTEIGWMISGTGKIMVVINGKSFSVDTDHMNYQDILGALRNKNYSDLENLLDVTKSVTKFTDGKVSVLNGVVYYGGSEVHSALTSRIISLMSEKMPFEPMIKFFENLMLNPSKNTCDQIYTFLEFNSLPICEDGCFFAYKRVTEDFKDFYTGKFDNSVGAVVKMPRNLCDDDMHRTCSTGLHICSKGYLPYYQGGAGKIIIVKVNPKDVVAVPVDYNNTKMRCCEYTVVAEIPMEVEKSDSKEYFTAPLYDKNGTKVKATVKAKEVAEHTEAFEEGYKAYNDGEWDLDNPYAYGTPEGYDWDAGYDKAITDESAENEDADSDDQVITTYHNVRDSKGRFVKNRTAANKPKRDSSGRFC